MEKHFTKFVEFANNFIKFVQFANKFTKFVGLGNNFWKVSKTSKNFMKFVDYKVGFKCLKVFFYLRFTRLNILIGKHNVS